MRLKVTITGGNEMMKTRRDFAHALRVVADKIERGLSSNKILDENGNSVGKFEFDQFDRHV